MQDSALAIVMPLFSRRVCSCFIRFCISVYYYNSFKPIDKARVYVILINQINLQGRVKFPTGGSARELREKIEADLVIFQSRLYSLDGRRLTFISPKIILGLLVLMSG